MPQRTRTRLHPIDDARVLTDQGLALTARALVVFLLGSGNRCHVAMIWFATQPAEEGTLQQGRVDPVGLGPPVFARHRHTRGMDHVSLDVVCPEPAREPKAITAGLKGDRNAGDRAPCRDRLVAPALEQSQQGVLVGAKLLQGMAIKSRHNPGDEPA